jgi:hypothetical protein
MFDFSLLVYPHLGARLTKEGDMQWLTVAWWRWRLAQALARNPLVRTSDRIEVAVMALAVAVSLAAMPVALAIGTAVHDGHARAYTAEQHDRHRVVATEDRASSPSGAVAVVQARSQVGDVENAGAFMWNSPVKDGSSIDIWVDRHGRQVGPPIPSWQAAADAVVAAVGIWLSVSATAALLVALVRRCLKHARYAGWSRDVASLVHDSGGRTNRHP